MCIQLYILESLSSRMKDLGIFFKICKSKLVIGESIIIVKKHEIYPRLRQPDR